MVVVDQTFRECGRVGAGRMEETSGSQEKRADRKERVHRRRRTRVLARRGVAGGESLSPCDVYGLFAMVMALSVGGFTAIGAVR
jgi:hypothetical protein